MKYDIKIIFLNMNDAFLFHVKVPKRYFINIQIAKLEISNYWKEPYFYIVCKHFVISHFKD